MTCERQLPYLRKPASGWTRKPTLANKLELRCRRHPNGLHEELEKAGWATN